jgi:exopolyphosphatase/guanosine-5'-triphosphate,3'-diphosphate pyrophosphatase
MLIVREVGGAIQTVAKVKRKVRLAAGLDDELHLDLDAMERGWQCLALFAEQLQDIPAQNVLIVATATLRSAINRDIFIQKAQEILGHPIRIISGEEEARIIYRGVAQTSSGQGKRLVIDIGGASTELIIGEQNQALLLNSLQMGCVSWLKRYFADGTLSQSSFAVAVKAAHQMLRPVISEYRRLGWKTCVGASGTIQALQEMMTSQGMDERITLPKLYQIRDQAIAAGSINSLDIPGLLDERKPVFPSGLSILIALFENLNIDELTLAGGALREGLVYGLLSQQDASNVRQRTAESLLRRHHIDTEQAILVQEYALTLAKQVSPKLNNTAFNMLKWAALFHEIGLTIEFKKAPQHAAYILDHSDLPGFTSAQKHLLSALLLNQRGTWQLLQLQEQCAIAPDTAITLARLLRIAVILGMRRNQEQVPSFTLFQDKSDLNAWILNFAPGWQTEHPLRAAELTLESENQPPQSSLEVLEALA